MAPNQDFAGRDHHGTAVLASSTQNFLVVWGGVNMATSTARHDAWIGKIDDQGMPAVLDESDRPGFWQSGMAVAVSGSRLYSISGYTGGNVVTPRVQSATVEDDGTLTWREEKALPGGLFHSTAVTDGKYLYVIGGRLGSGVTVGAIYRASIGSEGLLSEWKSLDPLPEPRSHHSAAIHQGKLHLLAGFSATSWSDLGTELNHHLVFDIQSDGSLQLSLLEDLGFFSITHANQVVDGQLFLCGGMSSRAGTISAKVRRAMILSSGALGPMEELSPLPRGRAHVHQVPFH